MPLMTGKSKKAFGKNVETEMHAGKPQKQALAIAYAMKRKAKKMAMGGMAGEQSSCTEHCESPCMVHDQANIDLAHESAAAKHDAMAMHEDDRKLGQHGEEEMGPDGTMMAEGGMMGEQDDSHEMDMVGRIMKQRQRAYSKGGMVANEDHGHNDEKLAGFAPNEFDDLALNDDLHSTIDSDSELGDARETHDRDDIIARIMKSRAKKDRLPNPA